MMNPKMSPKNLQDYQLQLMLLEQQNKKRFMVCKRANEEPNTGARSPTTNIGFDAPPPPQVTYPMGQLLGGSANPVETNNANMFSNMTISRDTTEGSGFRQEMLMALRAGGHDEVSALSDPGLFQPPTPLDAFNQPILESLATPMLGQPVSSMPRLSDFGGTHDQHSSGSRPIPAAAQPLPPLPSAGALFAGMPPSLASTQKVRNRSTADHKLIERLRQRVLHLEEQNKDLKAVQNAEKKPPRYQIFHKIDGQHEIYLEPPTWQLAPDDEIRLKGHLPIQSIDRFLQSRREIVFYVVRQYSAGDLDDDTKKVVLLGAEPPKAMYFSEEVVLEDDAMLQAVVEFFTYQSGLDPSDVKEKPVLKAPYLFWYHTRSQNTVQNLSEEHRTLMDLLTGWIDGAYDDQYREADALFASGLVNLTYIPFLFKPEEVIVHKAGSTYQGLMTSEWSIDDCSKAEKRVSIVVNKLDLAERKFISTIATWQYGFDGQFYKRRQTIGLNFSPTNPDGTMAVRDLQYFPLRFASAEVQDRLARRGRRFWSFRNKQLISYRDDRDATLNQDERFMVDFATYKVLHASHAASAPNGTQYEWRDAGDPATPSVPQIYLFPSSIAGYNLRGKKWMDLDVDRMSDVVWNKEAFENLVVEPDTKELVQALVTRQIAGEKCTDLIQNKGNGLVMLLHGGPGTGKTFTAESVAEMAEKPLFRVTCGDVGTQAEQVEKYLESVLHLGKIWDCVVLLDEADVFLEQRTLNDLTRNALVSVFLRVLEYYDGILILTSNRVSTFDGAFKSRIQLALHYESLSRLQRSRIWVNFFKRLRSLNERNIDYIDVEGYISQLADHEMNGRQIRNAITTARQLAQFQGQDMSYRHLKHVITVASKFDKHLGSTRGSSDAGDDAEGVQDDATTMSRDTWADWKKLDHA